MLFLTGDGVATSMWDLNDFSIILGGGIGFLIAAGINDALTRAQTRRLAASHPQRQARLTDDQRTRARYLGMILVALGVLILPVGTLSIAWLQRDASSGTAVIGGGILGGVGSCLTCIASSMLMTRGRRMRAPDAERTLARDVRPPIVYLRPFHFDRTSRVAAAHSALFKKTHEQRLARALRGVGPFVALGDPSETFPDLGADRLYPDQARWQQAVEGLTRTAGTIVLHVGDSPGLAWEVQHVVDLGQPERIILSLVTEDRQRYNDFRDKFCNVFPRGLLADIGSSEFLYFDFDWTPRAYERKKSRQLHAPCGPGEQRMLALRQLGDPKRAWIVGCLGFLLFAALLIFTILTL